MKIYDCFIFFNELDLLELRLNILDRYVDHFVIVESAITFQGQDKEFLFEKNWARFERFKSKIIHFKVEKYEFDFARLPYVENPKSADDVVLNRIYKFIDQCPHFDKHKEFWWGNDFFQRECIWRALTQASPAPDDMILISDVDEIPNPVTVVTCKEQLRPGELLCFRQHEFCYYLNYFHNSDWIGTCCFIYSSFENVSLNAIRFSAKRDEGLFPRLIEHGGWHFTSMGNVEAIKKKIMSWGHREYNNNYTLSSVDYNVKHGYDIFRRPGFGRLEYLPVEYGLLPAFLVDNVGMFEHLIGAKIEKEKLFQGAFRAAYYFFRSIKLGLIRRIKSVV